MAPYRTMRREMPMVLVGHASYPTVTPKGTPASLSKKWITEILRKKIGYRGLIVSDDLEMGGVLAAAPIEQAAVEFICAGGDLCLICRQEEFVLRAHEALIKEAERNRKFAERVRESSRRVLAFKRKSKEVKRRSSPPNETKLSRLSRQLWEFTEHVRLETINKQGHA
jgi:beta-N-acetylhexosaminidase